MNAMNGRRALAVALAGLTLLAASAAHAQLISIVKSNLVVGGTNTFFPYDTNTYFAVTGRVTSPFMSSSGSTEIYIQDGSSGIRVLSRTNTFQLETNSAIFAPGVAVYVSGRIDQTNGQRAIRPEFYQGNPFATFTDFYIADTNIVTVTPEVTTIANILANAEDYEGELVRINGLQISGVTSFTYQSSEEYLVSNGADSINIFVDRDTEIDGQLVPTNTFDLIGIVSQFSTAAIPSNGYEIVPRYYSDVIQTVGAEPPSVLLVTNATAIVNVNFKLNVVAQDLNAGDTLTITNTQAPAGATFTSGGREGLLSWTPTLADLGVTTTAIFEVSDGTTVVTGYCAITVRAASGGPDMPWINEFHYDNSGTDSNEFIEVAGRAGIALTNVYILLYNGDFGNLYGSNRLSGVIDDEGSGYGAVSISIPGLQNGGPPGSDGIALCSDSNGLLQFISYEGAFTPSTGIAAGVASIDIGVSEPGTTPYGQSLQLIGSGTNYESFTWAGPQTWTPGDINSCAQEVNGAGFAKAPITQLQLSPSTPSTGDAFYIQATITPNCYASNVSATAYYSINEGATNTIAMSDLGSYLFQSSSQVPGQPNNSTARYFVVVSFTGPGTNSPTTSTTNTYLIAVHPPVLTNIGNKSVSESNTLQFAVTATEQDGDPVTLTASNLPSGAIFSATNMNGTFLWTTPTPDGVYTTTFYAADKDGVDVETITITVNATVDGIAWINEIHYDNNSGDVNEGVEIAGTAGLDLSAYRLVLYNGFNGLQYDSDNLSGFIDDEQCGYGAVWFGYPANGLQNGNTAQTEPDGIALVRVQAGVTTVVQFLSYEGVFTAVGGPADGMLSTDIGVNQTGTVAIGFTLQLQGTGNTYSNFAWAWPTNAASTGTINAAQSLCVVGGDDDGDLLPNEWENQYFGGNTNASYEIDTDGDGFINLFEFIALTDPTNSSSFFEVTALVEAYTNNGGRKVSFQTATGRIYRVDFTEDVLEGTGWNTLTSGIPGSGSAHIATDTNASNGRLYRIEVHLP
jgi:hypothetical protein